MSRFLRAFALGLLIGGLAGLWIGINIGRDQPLFSNPLTGVDDVRVVDSVARTAAPEARSAAII